MADDDREEDKGYEEQIKFVSVIAKPLASKKSTKRVHKVVKKAAQAKHVRRVSGALMLMKSLCARVWWHAGSCYLLA
jgi:H/ACA ribonucleoprotein complex subunit 2